MVDDRRPRLISVSRFSLACAVTAAGATAAVLHLEPSLAPTDPAMLSCSSPGHPPVCYCYADGTPEDVIARLEQQLWQHWIEQGFFEGGAAFDTAGRWEPGGQGDPFDLTWSLAPDGLFIPDGGQGDGINLIHEKMIASFGSVEFGIMRLTEVFDRWSELIGVNYTMISDDGAPWGADGSANRGDVRIAAFIFPAGTSVLGYNSFPQEGDMVLNASANWSAGATDRFFRNIVAHEHGHGLGIQHVCPDIETKLMEPSITTQFDGPQHDDIRAGQRLYGDRFENNNSLFQATYLGFLGDGSHLEELVSIDDNSDRDYFEFGVDEGKLVSITVTPTGETYDEGPQVFGACVSDFIDTIDTEPVHDLNLILFNNDGDEVASADENPEGMFERIIQFPVAEATDLTVRVGGDNSNAIQLYSLTVFIQDDPNFKTGDPTPDLDGDGTVGPSDLALLLGGWGACPGVGECPADLDQDGTVGPSDLALLLGSWGNV